MSIIKNINKDEFVYNIGHKKISRFLPQEWGLERKTPFTTTNGFKVLCRYTYKMNNALQNIKKFYKKEFNSDNSYTIDEYIGIFQNLVNKINDIVTKKSCLLDDKEYNEDLPFEKQRNFVTYERERKILKTANKQAFVWDSGEMIGFSKDAYLKLLPLVKKMFMIEKMCSFTTRKFWKSEMTKPRKIDMNKPFKLVVRVVFPQNWRNIDQSHNIADYYRNKKYVSASIIDEKHIKNLFMYNLWKHSEAALLLLDCNEQNFVCADATDSYSEEAIDGIIPFNDDFFASQVNRVDYIRRNKKDYDFFSNAVEISTPKGVLSEIKGVSEVNLKNPKIIGVIAPNKISTEYAKKLAQKNKVPFYQINTFTQG